ncbi:MAG: metalloregulator ArsR/SmtB family transcription factor [Acidobacteriota bacterium]
MANHLDHLAALADPTRRAIFERLSVRALSVGELAAELPVSRPAVSQHLKVLKDARLVTVRSAGTRNVYAVDPKAVAAMRAYLDRFWNNAMAAFKKAVEEEEDA